MHHSCSDTNTQASVARLQFNSNTGQQAYWQPDRVRWALEARDLPSLSAGANTVQTTDSWVLIKCAEVCGQLEGVRKASRWQPWLHALVQQSVKHLKEKFPAASPKEAAMLRLSKEDKERREKKPGGFQGLWLFCYFFLKHKGEGKVQIRDLLPIPHLWTLITSFLSTVVNGMKE